MQKINIAVKIMHTYRYTLRQILHTGALSPCMSWQTVLPVCHLGRIVLVIIEIMALGGCWLDFNLDFNLDFHTHTQPHHRAFCFYFSGFSVCYEWVNVKTKLRQQGRHDVNLPSSTVLSHTLIPKGGSGASGWRAEMRSTWWSWPEGSRRRRGDASPLCFQSSSGFVHAHKVVFCHKIVVILQKTETKSVCVLYRESIIFPFSWWHASGQ